MFIVHCNRPSKSARALAKALDGRKVNLSKGVVPNVRHTVINWGDSQCTSDQIDLNKPAAIALAANKLKAFDAMAAPTLGVCLPLYARRKEDVTWKGLTVVRHKLTGHSGEGIEICEDVNNLPDAPLYVQYIKKEQEFRIHVGRKNGQTQIIAVQRKARDRSIPDDKVNWQVRNHANGFVFVRGDANPSPATIETACNALGAIVLDFGAVDIVYNAKEDKAYVLEINTAPGLEGQTIADYASFFRN